ncbi:MAG: hypothetical protein II994_03055 [Lachnospiraceae bacterium]|nr:hypothetical protein [Lachnospiraceae bacterium]
MSDMDKKKKSMILSELEKLGGAHPDSFAGQEDEYYEKIRAFLEGQDFLKLGYAIDGRRFELALMHVGKMKKKTEELKISCFDNYLKGIRGSLVKRSRSESLQIMTKITAKRVQLRNILGKGEYL